MNIFICSSLNIFVFLCINLSYILFFHSVVQLYSLQYSLSFVFTVTQFVPLKSGDTKQNNDPPVMAWLHSGWMHFLFAVNQLNFTTKMGPVGNIMKLCHVSSWGLTMKSSAVQIKERKNSRGEVFHSLLFGAILICDSGLICFHALKTLRHTVSVLQGLN